jgi:Glycosyl hydrolases family 2, TIM barrel domain/Glycosyl hydrolases family 2, sugar binding domain/Glycosyl hydrolases family 2/Beta galactosidase small chain
MRPPRHDRSPPPRGGRGRLPLVALALCVGCASKSATPGGAGGSGGAGAGAGGTFAGDAGVDAPAAGTGGVAATPVPLVNPTEVQYLSGRGSDDAVPWDFYCASALANNRNCTNAPGSGTWTTIPVPSNWELQGFGTYYYGTDAAFARGPVETGFYRLNFNVPDAWSGKRILIVFEGSMTDTDVKINGVSAGPTHQGAFYRFKYDVSSLVKLGSPNLLEVTVADESTNPSVSNAERSADYWVFGGIFRPVYLEATPAASIDHVGVDARADGALSVSVALQGVSAPGQITARVFDPQARQVGSTLSAPVAAGQASAALAGTIPGTNAWSAETPNLYRLVVSLEGNSQPVHQVVETIGFRTVEVRAGDGVYVNGKRVMFRGINRHSFWPSTGRALNATLSHDDVVLLKGMNVNAVRSSHYPPDRHFLDAADAMGLYVLDELAGWQHAYDTPGGTPLLQQMVASDANHPSIVFWDNGNEGGWNTALDASFGQLDPQRRAVLHPQQLFSGVQANHYPTYAFAQTALGGPNIFMPTEFMHGLYDGGGGAGLDDYWSLMRGGARSAGGFIWALLDEGVVRTDDPQRRIDTRGNQAPDGVTGPYREKEGSYNTIRDIWSPVQVTLTTLPGAFTVENRYDFTDAASVLFRWQLVDYDFSSPAAGHVVAAQGTARTASIPPGGTGPLVLAGVPADWADHHALLLGADDAGGQTIGQWSWMIATAQGLRQKVVATAGPTPAICGAASAGTQTVTGGGISYTFSTMTGLLTGVSRGGSTFALQNGPTLTMGSGATQTAANGALQSFTAAPQGNDCVVTATYAGALSQVVWQVMSSGWLRLSYRYALTGAYDFYGVTFDYPEARVQSAQWLGKGPYRVWKNRMRGTTDDVWTRDYNDAVTGGTWTYPEFKGYFAGVDWARLTTTEGVIHFVFDSRDTFLRLYSARDGAAPQTTQMVFPPPTSPGGAAGLSFLQGIPAIGTKFDAPSALGPQSQPNMLAGAPVDETMYMFFGDITALPPVAP